MNSALIIDDDPIHTEVSRAMLKAMGVARVSSASDGETARTLLADSEPFDLLVLDLNMPKYNGVEFLDHLREINFCADIVVASAASASIRSAAEHLAKAYGLNITSVLEKPLTLKKLTPALAHT